MILYLGYNMSLTFEVIWGHRRSKAVILVKIWKCPEDCNFLHNNCENKAAFKYYVSMLERVEGVGAKKADIEDGGKGELDPRA